jgi:hypothetical protein
MKGLFRQISIIAGTLATVAVNYLANAIPIGGISTGAAADLYKIFFFPAGYAFSIWGLIYLGLGAFTVWQALPAQRSNERLDKIGWLYILSCLGNIVWIFVWQYQYPAWTIIPMVVILEQLLHIYITLGIGKTQVSTAEKWLVHVPFSIYVGWITVATIACVSAGLYSLGWDGFGIDPQVWAVVMMGIAFLIVAFMVWRHRDVAWGLVFIWAIVAIAVRFSDIQLLYIPAYAFAGLMAVEVILSLFLKPKSA